MKRVKQLTAILLALILAFSMMIAAADSANVTITHEGNLATLNWEGDNVAYIDFTEVEEIDLDTGASGNGLTLCPNNGQTSWRAANRLSDNGYLLFGKEGNTDENGTLAFGNVYISLDDENKGNYSSYAIKVDYYGGGGMGLDSGSYINFAYNTASKADQGAPQYKFGSTYNSGQIESCYWLLTDAKFRNAMNNPHGDFRLNTWSGAQIWIRRISVMQYNAIDFPDLTEVRKGVTEEIASIDFSTLNSIPSSGTVAGDGLTLLTNESTGSNRASNILEDGYLLLGRQARANDNPEDMEDKPLMNGAIYIRIDKTLEEKANTPYAIKIEYFGGGLGLNSASFIDVRYHNNVGSNNASVRKTFGSTYNSGQEEVLYHLVPLADFNQTINGSSCGGDFRLETWCGDGSTTGAQMKIKKISVVKYDGESVTTNDQAAVLFRPYSGGELIASQAVVNADTGEFNGLQYIANTAEQVKVTDSLGNVSYGVQPVYSGTLGTLGFKITDAYVKAAKNAVLTVSYWDIGEGSFSFEFNATDSNYKATGSVELTGTNTIKTQAITLSDTAFAGAQTGGYDFKLLTRTAELTIVSVQVEAVIEGDISGDGLLNASDFVLIHSALLGIDETEYDINNDLLFDVLDLIALKKLAAN